MALRDLASQRVFIDLPLRDGASVSASPEQANYLRNVLRMNVGDELFVFNGKDGEWRAKLRYEGKRGVTLEIDEIVRAQTEPNDIWYVFAPLKRARLDYVVQKAVEMGASRLVPVMTRHTVADRINGERMVSNVIEAAEQCGVLNVPQIVEPASLEKTLATWPKNRHLIFCDESAVVKNPLEILLDLPQGPAAVLIGPEGGFSKEERELIVAKPFVIPISLGPRVMRADTAGVAALALLNASLGDWR